MTAKSTKKRRAKIIGGDQKEPVIAAANEDGSIEIIEGRSLGDGEALPVGSPLYVVHRSGDEHCLETIVEGDRDYATSESKGPAKVASAGYRRGYDAVFGKPKNRYLN